MVQRRGRGGIQFRAPKKGRVAPTRYPEPISEVKTGVVANILHERGVNYPIAQVKIGEDQFTYIPAVTGLTVGSTLQIGEGAELKRGNILPLKDIPEGSTICNIELLPGDGGKLVKSAGGSAILLAHTASGALVKLPSGNTVTINGRCRATVGDVAGGGRGEKPFLRAGPKYHLMKAKVKPYPRVRGVAMAVVYHPFGGGRHQHPGKSTSTKRTAPPGRKIGLIAPRKTGRKRIARVKVEVRR